MHGYAGGFAYSHQAFDDRLRIIALLRNNLAIKVGRNSAHVVMNRWQNRNGFLRHIASGEDSRRLSNTRETFFNDLRSEVLKMQMNVI